MLLWVVRVDQVQFRLPGQEYIMENPQSGTAAPGHSSVHLVPLVWAPGHAGFSTWLHVKPYVNLGKQAYNFNLKYLLFSIPVHFLLSFLCLFSFVGPILSLKRSMGIFIGFTLENILTLQCAGLSYLLTRIIWKLTDVKLQINVESVSTLGLCIVSLSSTPRVRVWNSILAKADFMRAGNP